MNKKVICVILVLLLGCTFTGCSIDNFSSTAYEENVASYKYSGDNSRFKAVSHEHIDDGEDNGEEITVLVDKHTKVMYLQTEKYDNGVTVGLCK